MNSERANVTVLDEHLAQCSELLAHGGSLSAWETKFIRNMAELLKRGWPLSAAQKGKLDQIYEQRRDA